jgi:peptidoglycan/xylan/chitin deacetylase (PgdA/CDA1 family)
MMRDMCKSSFYTLIAGAAPILKSVANFGDSMRSDPKIPILVYHKISNIRQGIDAFWNVPPALFKAHMDYLFREGFCVLSLQEYHSLRQNGEKPPPQSVVITFDDGYGNFFIQAFPVLRHYGFPATVFLVGLYTGKGQIFWWDEDTLRESPSLYEELRTLHWEEILEMQSSGLVTFGSHTMTHPHLGRLDKSSIDFELEQSKRLLEENLQREVKFFAYPGGIKKYGDISDASRSALIEKGYGLACTSESGRNSVTEDNYALKRLGIGSRDSLSLFAARVAGGLDWLSIAQSAFQRIFKGSW